VRRPLARLKKGWLIRSRWSRMLMPSSARATNGSRRARSEPVSRFDIIPPCASAAAPCRSLDPRSRFGGPYRPSVRGHRRDRRRGRQFSGRLDRSRRCDASPVFDRISRATGQPRVYAGGAAADRPGDRACSCSIARARPRTRGFRVADQHRRDQGGSGWSKMGSQKPTRDRPAV
jgi:hypothetical protein